MSPADAYIRRETVVSVAINTALSLLFFLIVFGRSSQPLVWGVGNYVFDFLPQGFMVAAMGTLVPGLLASKALASGKVAPLPQRPPSSMRLLPRALFTGFAGAALGTGGAGAILGLTGLSEIGWWSALIGKVMFGAGLGAIVTPLALRAVLARR